MDIFLLFLHLIKDEHHQATKPFHIVRDMTYKILKSVFHHV